jgi:predicted DsbA family dithiol-disulfide isomerase
LLPGVERPPIHWAALKAMTEPVALAYFSDVLCVWAHISQARVDEVAERFPDDVSIGYRFCSVFGDTANKIGVGWADRGGYLGFAEHLRESVAAFDHIKLHPEIWQRDRPASSTPAHILMKAVQRVDASLARDVLHEIRSAFFERCHDVGSWSTLKTCVEAVGLSAADVRAVIDNGVAHADLEADHRDQQKLMIQGSPTFILNEGRQKLYGNVGYGVIEANIKELLRSPEAGAASWC